MKNGNLMNGLKKLGIIALGTAGGMLIAALTGKKEEDTEAGREVVVEYDGEVVSEETEETGGEEEG